jgi:sugar/nucleoside kinase (ribokinase family)
MIKVFGELALHIFSPMKAAPLSTCEGAIQLGGGAAMIARSLVARGVRTELIGLVGDDAMGDCLCALFRRLGCEGELLRQSDARSSIVYLFHDAARLNSLSILPGDIQPLKLCSYAAVSPADLVYCPLFPGYEELASKLTSTGARILLDLGFGPWSGDYERLSTVLYEAPPTSLVQFSGEGLSEHDKGALVKLAIGRGFGAAILTSSASPIIVATPDGTTSVLPTPREEVCAVGAGDVFASGVLAGLERGEDLHTAVEQGVSWATEKVTKWGVLE